MSTVKPFLFPLVVVLLLIVGSSCNRNPNNEQAVESTLLKTDTSLEEDSLQIITAWLNQTSVPVQHLEAGNGFADLHPLKQVLKDVKVVGLGEATHGTREFFTMKHRLLEFLVSEMNFTAFVMESSYSACQPINDYILTGKGDRATVLTNQGYAVWDNEEFSSILEWLKTYNQKVPDEKKVKFYGNDSGFNGVGRERVLAFLQKYAPEKVTATDAFFKVLATEEEKWPFRLNQIKLQQAFIPLQELISFFNTNKDRLISVSSSEEWERVYKHAQVMEQWILASLQETPPSLTSKKLGRNQYMAQNLLYLIEKEKPDTKFMVWAHNGHISNFVEEETVGAHLKKRFGNKYYALSLKCGQGTFRTRELLPDNFMGDLKADTILPAEKSLGWYLSRVQKGNFFIDLRPASPNPVVEKWMATPIKFGSDGWVHNNAKQNNYETRKLKGLYDGIIFIEHSTPANPTKNTKYRSANRIGI